MGYSEFKNINTQNTAATQQTAGSTSATKPQTSSSTSSTPIPVGQNTSIQDRCTQLVQSEEFKNLTDKEKLELLKKDFPQVNEATLKEVLNTVKTTIASDSTAGNGFNSIDDMIKALKAKPKDKLTAQEKQLLAMFDKDGNLVFKKNKESQVQFAKMMEQISAQLAQTPGWEEKSASDKLNALLDVIIGQMIPGYADYPDGNKTNLRSSFIDKIGKTFYKGWDGLSKETKNLTVQLVAVLMEQVGKGKKFSLEDILIDDANNTKKKEFFKEILGDVLDKYLVDNEKINLDEITKDENGNTRPPEAQLNLLIEGMIRKACPDMDEKDIKAALPEMTELMCKAMFKNEWPNLNDPNAKNKRAVLTQSLLSKTIALKEYNDDKNDDEKICAHKFLNDIGTRIDVLEAYESRHKIDLTDNERLQREVSRTFQKEPITPQDMLTYIENKVKDFGIESLSDEESKLYARYDELKKILENGTEEQRQQLKQILNSPLTDVSNTGAYLIRAQYNNNQRAWLQDYCKNNGLDINNLSNEDKKKILNTIGDYSMMVQIGTTLLGFKNETAIFNELGFVNTTLAIFNIDIKNPELFMDALGSATHMEDKGARDVALGVGAVIGRNFEPKHAARFIGKSIDGKYGKENAIKIPKLQVKYGWDKEHIAKTNTIVINDKTIDTDIRGTLLDSTIENAPDDNTRTYYGKHFSQNAKDPDMLEYLGAASRHVQDPAKKEQYNKSVTTAAAKYPPEVQERVAKAIETGEVSPETKAKTASGVTSDSPATKSASKPKQKAPVTDDTKLTQTPTVQTTPTVPTTTKTPAGTPAGVKNANAARIQALADKKDRVAENILNYQEEVKRELSAREVQDIKETLVAISNGTIDENMENHMKNIIATNNVEMIYKAISNMGADIVQTFITALTSYGSPEKILAFANVIKDDTAMLQSLYFKCTSENVRARILKLMPSSVIYSMIASGQITNLSEIDPSLLYGFLMQNMSTMSLNSISNYLKYLPFEDRERIVAMLNGNDDEIQPEISANDDLAQNAPSMKTTQPEQDKAQQQEQDEVQPEIKANELTATRNDGTEIKRKTSFGAVSSTDFSESYEEVTNKTGLSRSAQEEVYTPGSPEWLRKYNKQQDVPPATAFTMAALEEDDELGMPFGSTKVGMGQKIKKKYPPQSFRFKA